MGHCSLSAVTDDLYIVCVVGGFIPLEADAPLIVDANAALLPCAHLSGPPGDGWTVHAKN